MISKEEVKKLADLARVEMSEPELEKLTKDLESILGYVSELKEAPASRQAGLAGEAEDNLVNILREDGNAYEPGTHTADLVKAMSKSRDNYLSVKPILDKNK